MKVRIAVSNRHVHLSKEVKDVLFGEEYEFCVLKELRQKGQVCYKETVSIMTDGGLIENVRVLGPVRKNCQVEISKSDSMKLRIDPPLRDSGDLVNSSMVTLIGPKGKVRVYNSTIIALRHIHMNKEDALGLGVKDKDIVSVKVLGKRGGVFDNVLVRVRDSYTLEMHIDRDEANGFGIESEDMGEVVVKKRA